MIQAWTKSMRALWILLLAACLPASAADKFHITDPRVYTGMCDASAAVPVSSNLFIVVSDENNVLRLYSADKSGPPIKKFDLNAFLNFEKATEEADLEAAARIGKRAFWMGSHGANKNGKVRTNRRALFATDIVSTNGEIGLVPAGRPYTNLLDDLSADPRFKQFNLEAAALRAPKNTNALNIEGISSTPDGHLLIGFRNPIPGGKALIIPLLNPNEVIHGHPGRFDPAILLDLGGLGVRDIARYENAYIIIGGPFHADSDFRLYRWGGPEKELTVLPVDGLNNYQPEGLIIYPQYGLTRFQVLSDDGTRMIDNCPCKDLKDPNKQAFRSFWISP